MYFRKNTIVLFSNFETFYFFVPKKLVNLNNYTFLYLNMKTQFQVEDLLVIDEITKQSQDMIDSIGSGNFSKTPQTFEELFLTIAKIMRGDFN